jgi:hypothetical protein
MRNERENKEIEMFHVGQKVVCVDGWDNNPFPDCPNGVPKTGCVYTVRGYSAAPTPKFDAIWLDEIINPQRKFPSGMWEPSFNEARFSPLDKRKTDISIFTEMLTGERKEAPVAAH